MRASHASSLGLLALAGLATACAAGDPPIPLARRDAEVDADLRDAAMDDAAMPDSVSLMLEVAE